MTFPLPINPQYYDIETYDYMLICEAHRIFKREFIDNNVFFDGTRVLIEGKLLDCSNCGYICNNNFSCDKCPWAGKEDIFQHITSDKDEALRLSREYKKQRNKYNRKLNDRTPGILNKERTSRISWIKYIIERCKINGDIDGIKCKIKPDVYNKQKEKIKIYDANADFLIILSRSKNQYEDVEIFLNSAYNNPPYNYLKDFR